MGDSPDTASHLSKTPRISRHVVRVMSGYLLLAVVTATAADSLRTPVLGHASIGLLLLPAQAALTGAALFGHARDVRRAAR